ncbi:hypothetical protein [Natronobiforma cellulositropha]|uniref:hypothetical protein n=1 Tax=Natronobiforma cellulositropha TaxID=1679076 RepID=UPI0021D576D2|nr:hypothetical protein [Natronobiforma cellulositropha]
MRRRQLLAGAGASIVGIQSLSGSASACVVCRYDDRYYKKEGDLVWVDWDGIYGEQEYFAPAEVIMEVRDAKVYGAWAKVDNFFPYDDDFTLKVKAAGEWVGPDLPVIRMPSSETAAVDFDPDHAESRDDILGMSLMMKFPGLDIRPVESNSMCGPSYTVEVEGHYDTLELDYCGGDGEPIDSLPDWTDDATDDATEHDDDSLLPWPF